METSNKQTEHITTMLRVLSDNNLEMVDFDSHRQWLRELSVLLPELYRMEEEASILRKGYIERIAGMVKAIAVVSRRQDSMKETLAYLETLSTRSAKELVEQYRLVSGRFRDAFPASFHPIGAIARSKTKKSEQYKH